MIPVVLVAGLTGTVLMTATMWFIHRSGWANADMTRALGSLVTKRYEGSLGPGLLIHITAGILFAVPYVFIMRTVAPDSILATVAVGAAIGMFHGAGMSFILLALVAEAHPVEKFRGAGPEVAAAHIVGHVVYGIGVGLAASLMGMGLPALTTASLDLIRRAGGAG